MNFCCLADSFKELSQEFGCLKVSKDDLFQRAFSNLNKTGLYRCNSKTCSLRANKIQTLKM